MKPGKEHLRGKYHVIELSSSAISVDNDEAPKRDEVPTPADLVQEVRSPLYADESGTIPTIMDIDAIGSLNDPEVQSTAHQESTDRTTTILPQYPFFKWMIIYMTISIVFLSILRMFATNNNHSVQQKGSFTSTEVKKMSLDWGNLAFGSCTSYDLRDWTIFTNAIVPSTPDAWLWAGDFAYLDDSDMNCNSIDRTVIELPEWQATCNCSESWITTPPYSCHAGDVEYIRDRWQSALNNAPYNAFLDYMCPTARSLGLFPPPGTNNKVCKPLMGIYDDHDFGWNNGNRRLPHKDAFKNMYLDAVGESQQSPRRGALRGAWGKYTLNEGLAAGIHIDVFLLDERYERDPLPCDTRRAYCEDVVLSDTTGIYRHERAFCQDFLYGGPLGQGTCCDKDEKLFFGWCRVSTNVLSPLWREACDVSYELFGHRSLYLNRTGGLEVATGVGSSHGSAAFSDGTVKDMSQESSFCDVLGREQRQWLRQAIGESTAAVKVFVSPSVLLSNPLPTKCGSKSKIKTKTKTTPSSSAGGFDPTTTVEATGADVMSKVAAPMNERVIGQDGTGDSVTHNLLEVAKLVGIRSETFARYPPGFSEKFDAELREDNVGDGGGNDNNHFGDKQSGGDSGDHLEDNLDREDVMCRCGGDNLDCYRVAQQELMYLISASSSIGGCGVVLTGDFHWSDIKQLTPGDNPAASAYAPSTNPLTGDKTYTFPKPIHQLMASGMSTSTGSNVTCDSFRLDPLGLRTHPECSFVRGPSFGRVQFQYSRQDLLQRALESSSDDDFDDDGIASGGGGSGDDGDEKVTCDDKEEPPPPAATASSQKERKGVSAQCARSIEKIVLQVLGGSSPNDVRLEHVIDVNTCLALG